jgi:hypothetical protein
VRDATGSDRACEVDDARGIDDACGVDDAHRSGSGRELDIGSSTGSTRSTGSCVRACVRRDARVEEVTRGGRCTA